MRVDTRDMISISEAGRQGVSRLVSEAQGGRTLVLMKHNEPAAVLVGADQAERLQRVEEAVEDLRLLALALVRSLTDTGDRHSLDDVAAELGVDLDED